MKDKINIAELLKDCPKGMELDCTMYDKVILVGVDNDLLFPIKVRRKDGCLFTLTKYGQYCDSDYAKCVIFPKGKTTWEGFQRPFNDGDIVYTIMDSIAILNNRIREHSEGFYAYCGLFNYGFDFDVIVSPERLATKEEKEKLFQAIKDNGYRWNAETKTLEKLPKFKVGDKIVNVLRKSMGALGTFQGTISEITGDKYILTDGSYMLISCQDNYELVSVEPQFNVGDSIRHKNDKTVITITGIKDNYYLIQFYNLNKNDYQNEKVSFKDQDKYELVPNNFDNNTFEKLVEPEFKIGDIIQYIDTYKVKITEINIDDECYGYESIIAKGIGSIPFNEQGNWKLVQDKFDITTLVPFESRVLMRSSNARKWTGTLFSHYSNNKFYGCGMCCDQCIPYEGNEHLLGKTNDCAEYFKTWK